MKRLGPLAVLAACVALQAGLAVHAMRGNSATFDEGAHLPAGYTHLALGDHRLNPEQPPLAKLLAAVPLLLFEKPVVRTDDRSWREARQWEFGRRFLYRWNDGRRLLFLGRLPIVALASLLVVAVFVEARRRFGDAAGCAAAALAAFSPDVLAHGSLVTTDLAFALFFFLAVVLFARLAREPRATRLLAAGLVTGAAFASKFSGPVLVVTLAVLALAAALDPEELAWRIGPPRKVTTAARKLACTLSLLVFVCALGLAVVWASYGFRRELSPDPAVRAAALAALEQPAVASPWSRLALAAAHAGIVPEDYARGFLFVMTHSQGRATFLLGELSDHGFPHYFLVTFLLKTPVPLLLLVVVAAWRARRLERRVALPLWLPVLSYVAVTFARSLQIGNRHLLPIYPFLFVLAGEAVAALAGARPRSLRGQATSSDRAAARAASVSTSPDETRAPIAGSARDERTRPSASPSLARSRGGAAGRLPRSGILAVALLLAWYVGSALWTHPHHLAYFNEIAGGPANGWRLLVDSNLDWGQDLGRLGDWMRASGVPRLKLSYFGSADPGYHGVDAEMLPGYTAPHPLRVTREIAPGDLVAVSATNLQGVYLDPEDRPLMARLRALTPIARVGWSILVYRADFRWPDPSLVPPREDGPATPSSLDAGGRQ